MPSPAQSPDEPGADFAAVLSSAIAQRNLTLERIAHRLRAAELPVSIATLSYWQTGRSLPTRSRSLKVVQELERILEVPTDHLTGALPGDALGRFDPMVSMPEGEALKAVLEEMGLGSEHRHHTVVNTESVVVDDQHRMASQRTRGILRSDVEGLRSFPAVFLQSKSNGMPPAIEAVRGITLGQVVQLEELNLLVAELVLPNPLARGELACIEYVIEPNLALKEDDSFARLLRPAMHYSTLELTFEGQLPRTITHRVFAGEVDMTDDLALETQTDELPVAAFAQTTLVNPQPGIHGLEWEW